MELFEYKTLFVDVIAPVPVKGTFSYRVPNELNGQVKVGQRVAIQFGPKKILSGIVARITEEVPKVDNIKYILGIIDENPIVSQQQLDFWQWMSDYYMCCIGEVMQAALPSALRLSSESMIELSPDYILDSQALNDYEYLIVEALQIQPKLSLSEVSKIVNYRKVMPLIKTMIEKHIIVMEEDLQDKYKAKYERFVRLSGDYYADERMAVLMDALNKRAPKQLDVLMAFYVLGGSRETDIMAAPLLKKADANLSVLKALAEKGVFELYEKKVSRLVGGKKQKEVSDIELTPAQQQAIDETNAGFANNKTVLLHGVTSSGKTEIYIKLIQKTIDRGKQVLYLVPEIALTEHMINRLKVYFGDRVGVYHSRYGDNERVEVWQQMVEYASTRSVEHQIVIGSRSALFLPFTDIGLIIVDEEHDSSFKQVDPSPRYNARDCALMLASMHKSNVVLGSATPSYESYFNALSGKYALVKLTERFGGARMPEIIVSDLREENRRKTMKSHFGSTLYGAISQALEKKNQVILFQNRRGFSLRLECGVCNHVPQCINCDVSLIYHKKSNMLRCHYCGYTTPVPNECPSCHSTDIRMRGFGTEKVEEDLQLLFPEASVARLDLDTTRAKTAYHDILEQFGNQTTDMLVGTQMVTKGLDFDNVKVVGILNADGMLSYPDFRASERAFQLMSQVSGRAGRKGEPGKVVIQTYQPAHPVILDVIANDYDRLFQDQMIVRKQFSYPPFYRLIQIKLRHVDSLKLDVAADYLQTLLHPLFGDMLLGPEYPAVSRIKNQYIKQFLIKFRRDVNPAKVKQHIEQSLEQFHTSPQGKSVTVQIDVDPY